MDSTPPRKESKKKYNFTPNKNNRNNGNIHSFGTPVSSELSYNQTLKKSNLSKIFNDEFIEYINNKIPILKYENLLELIINYCDKLNKRLYLSNITSSLRTICNLAKLNGFNNTNNIVFQKNGKFIKSYIIRGHGLIEGLIHATINYYTLNNFSPMMNSLNRSKNNTSRFNEIMNISNGLSLDEYIKNLFNSDLPNKKEILIKILINITIKINELQNLCGFIHGDLNEQNIFVNINTLDIFFIDFGRSIINLPIYTNYNLILYSPTNENLNYKYILDLNNNEVFKGLDLFYLIEKLSRFNKSAFSNFNNYIDIINSIKSNYNIKVNNRMELFEFIYSDEFLFNSDIIKLYPINFIKILELI